MQRAQSCVEELEYGEGQEVGQEQSHPETQDISPSATALMEEYRSYAQSLVRSLIKHMNVPEGSQDDLISAGYLGLVEAATRYHVDSGVPFHLYARQRIRGAVIDEIRRSSGLSGKYYRYLRAYREYLHMREMAHSHDDESGELAASPFPLRQQSTQEIAERLFRRLSEGVLLQQLSLEGVYRDEKEDEYEEEYASITESFHPRNRSPEQNCISKERREFIRKFVKLLPEKERVVIEQHYFQDRVFSEIADETQGLTRSWLSRVHRRALKRLAKIMMEHPFLEGEHYGSAE